MSMTTVHIYPTTPESYYPEDLKRDMAAFNRDLAQINTERDDLTRETVELRAVTQTGAVKNPDKVPSEVAKLQARRVALDVAELKLLPRKAAFQQRVLDARKQERERNMKLAQERRAVLEKHLAEIGTAKAQTHAVIAADNKVVEYNAIVGGLSEFVRVVRAEDEERGAVLSARLAALVPPLER